MDQFTVTGSMASQPVSNALIGIPKHVVVKFDDYADVNVRLKTFNSWPPGIKITGEIMANAGFYYTGQSDVVVCYACGVVAKDWHAEDEPIVEHIRFRNNCRYVNFIKSEKFIKNALKTFSKDKVLLDSNDMFSYHERPKEKPVIGDDEIKKDTSEGQEIKKVSDSRACIVCLDNEVDMLLWPCRHIVCNFCGLRLTNCPVCRHKIENSCKIFFS